MKKLEKLKLKSISEMKPEMKKQQLLHILGGSGYDYGYDGDFENDGLDRDGCTKCDDGCKSRKKSK